MTITIISFDILQENQPSPISLPSPSSSSSSCPQSPHLYHHSGCLVTAVELPEINELLNFFDGEDEGILLLICTHR